ncbi:MAG: diaminopimelate epimerase [Rhodobiaceae bacterium]|nr:diaminopimelate epimerase [Rhodobiaceae bacterium]
MAGSAIPFRKMNGLGNEFVVFDGRRGPVRLSPEAIQALGAADSIGFDQMITIERAGGGADAFMRIHNRDGGEVDACGNATRCVGWLLIGESGKADAVIETNAGLLRAWDAGAPETMTVDMGRPRFRWDEIPLAEEFHDTRMIELQIGPIDAPVLHSPSVVSMGNPHAIFWVDRDVWSYDLDRFGPLLENHPIFPERANISIAQIRSRSEVTIRTWERGAGLTRACGSAACATAVAAMRLRRMDRQVTVHVPGGPLGIEWRDDNHVVMTGPAEWEFSGTLDPATGAWTRDAEGVA